MSKKLTDEPVSEQDKKDLKYYGLWVLILIILFHLVDYLFKVG